MLDVDVHRRGGDYAINQFGYRGPTRFSKRAGERRASSSAAVRYLNLGRSASAILDIAGPIGKAAAGLLTDLE